MMSNKSMQDNGWIALRFHWFTSGQPCLIFIAGPNRGYGKVRRPLQVVDGAYGDDLHSGFHYRVERFQFDEF
jgi:hypothetical protein